MFILYYLSPYHIISIQQKVENEQNNFMNENSLYAITAKFEQGFYDELSPIDIAMIYFEDCVNKHIFQNGNKRTAIITAILFLEINGLRVNAENDILYDKILQYFEGKNYAPLKEYLETVVSTRNYDNPSIHEVPYHLENDNFMNKYQELIYNLSLT